MRQHRVITTDTEVDAAIAQARAQENDRPRAIEAHYDASDDKVVIRLASGIDIAIPRASLQGLEKATGTQVADIELEAAGSGLHWPSLDVDHYIPGLLAGVFGTKRWMSELGRKGGAVRSAAKAAAARANGRKGGRPRTRARAIAARSLTARRKPKRATPSRNRAWR